MSKADLAARPSASNYAFANCITKNGVRVQGDTHQPHLKLLASRD
jgi:hypothetical protein